MSTFEQVSLLINGYIRNRCYNNKFYQDIVKLIVLFFNGYEQLIIVRDRFNGKIMPRSKPIRSSILKLDEYEFQLKVYPIGINKPHKDYVMMIIYALNARQKHHNIRIFVDISMGKTNFIYRGMTSFGHKYYEHYQYYLPMIPRKEIIPLLTDKMIINYKLEIIEVGYSKNSKYQSFCRIRPDQFLLIQQQESKCIKQIDYEWNIDDEMILNKLKAPKQGLINYPASIVLYSDYFGENDNWYMYIRKYLDLVDDKWKLRFYLIMKRECKPESEDTVSLKVEYCMADKVKHKLHHCIGSCVHKMECKDIDINAGIVIRISLFICFQSS